MTKPHGRGAVSADVVDGPLPPATPPSPLTSFIGRQPDIDAVSELLVATPLVTLTGPGGTGKTRLSLAVAERTAGRGDETWVVDLTPLESAELVPAAIATAVGVRATAKHPPLDLVARRIGSSGCLLVLDNMEHVVEAAPELVDLVARCPALRLLVTSRRPLRLSFERTYEVPPLATELPDDGADDSELPPAVAVFVDRARAANGLGPDTDEVEVIADICARLGGLPLAIELAAARTRHLSARTIRDRLEAPLMMLSGGAVDAPDRHRTLRQTIAWSHELLDEPTATVFGRLGIFAGSFGLSAAHEVAGHGISESDGETLEIIEGLADESLLTAVASSTVEPRFRMHVLIREYAMEVVDDEAEGRARHLAHYLRLAERAAAELDGLDQARWTKVIADEVENLREALDTAAAAPATGDLLRLASALGGYWRRDGDLREGRRWLSRALAESTDPPASLRARASLRLAAIEHMLGDMEAALLDYTSAYEAASAASADHDVVESLVGRGIALGRSGEFEQMAAAIGQADAIARASGDPATLVQARMGAAMLASMTRPADAAAEFEAALELARTAGDRHAVVLILGDLALTRIAAGDPAGAVPLLEESIAYLEGSSGATDAGWACLTLGLALGQIPDLERAREAIDKGARLALAGGLPVDQIFAAEAAADWLGRSGAASEALRAWAAAGRERESAGLSLETADRFWVDPGIARDRAAVPPSIARASEVAGRSLGISTAIREALDAMRVASPQVADATRPRDRFALTKREREVLQLLADGYGDGDIAEELFISRKTASVHVANIKGKLEASSRVEIVTTALRMGLVEAPADLEG